MNIPVEMEATRKKTGNAGGQSRFANQRYSNRSK